jgi:hypothetical protein
LAVSWWPGDGDASDIYGTNSPTETIGASYFAPAMVLEGIAIRFAMSDGVTVRAVETQPVATGVFHHVAVLRDLYRDSLSIYLDGVLRDVHIDTTPMNTSNASAFHIGHPSVDSTGSTGGLRGVVDELKYFYRDLTWCEGGAIHGAGEEGACRQDRDADSVLDYRDNCPDIANPGHTDSDSDHAGDVCDCRSPNFEVHHHPGEAGGLRTGVELVAHRLGWCTKHYAAGQETDFTVARGMLDELPVGSGGTEICLASAFEWTRFDDTEDPPEGRGYWYILRAHNECRVGTWGYDSHGTERNSPVLESCLMTESELCANSGGYWDIGSCGHYECGMPPGLRRHRTRMRLRDRQDLLPGNRLPGRPELSVRPD